MERVLVFGAKGMLGSAIMDSLSSSFELVGFGHEELDVTDEKATRRAISDLEPGIVIHAAAYTDVDGCETNPEESYRVNGQGTLYVVQACRETKSRLVYLSTDYVFDGKTSRPYREEDPVNPINVYGKSKLQGEQHVSRLLTDFIIIRTQWLFGKTGKNFVTTVLDSARDGKPMTIIRDQIGSPTYVMDLSCAISQLLRKDFRGIFHVANSSFCSWYEFAKKILEQRGVQMSVVPVDSDSLHQKARRPRFSALGNFSWQKAFGEPLRHWEDALKDFLRSIDL